MEENNAHIQRKNIQALAIGMLLIVFVGVFFIAKSFRGNTNEEVTPLSTDSDAAIQKKTLSATDLNRKILLGEKMILIDVRSEDEYNYKHIPKSRSYPKEAVGGLVAEKDTPFVIISAQNDTVTSETVTNILKDKGINFIFLSDGFENWSAKGYPTVAAGDPRDFVDQSKVTYITRENVLPLITAGGNIYILDVQKTEGYNAKHIDGALNIPLSELEKRAGEIPAGKKIVVYGANELESFQGGVRLFDLNIFGALTLRGNDNLKPGSPFTLKP